MEEINKSCLSRPNLSNERFPHCIIDEYVSLCTLIESNSLNLYASVNDRNVSIVFLYFLHITQRKVLLIDGKVLKIKHVVDIRPNCIQRNTIFFIILQYLQQL